MNSGVLLIKIVLDFLNRLEDSQIEDLLNKRAYLKLESCSNKVIIAQTTKEVSADLTCESLDAKTTKDDAQVCSEVQKAEKVSIDSICETLEAKTTRDDAQAYLMELNLTKSVLKLLVKHYKIPLTSKATNAQMIDAIIEAVVGAKIRYEALYNTDLSK